jgi:hypothetical protein
MAIYNMRGIAMWERLCMRRQIDDARLHINVIVAY